MSPDDSSTASGAINLSIKPAGLDESEKDYGGGKVSDDHEHPTSPSPSILKDNKNNKDALDSVSDTPSENLLTGKPIIYPDVHEVINRTSRVQGTNKNSTNKSDTTLQSLDNVSENANSKHSIKKSNKHHIKELCQVRYKHLPRAQTEQSIK